MFHVKEQYKSVFRDMQHVTTEKKIFYVRKNLDILLRVVTSTHRLIIETLPAMVGFCRFWSIVKTID